MSLKNSYFAIPDPLRAIERWFNPEIHMAELSLQGKPLKVSWTRRAERALARRDTPLLAEMQLYFSCVVKKRVLFHQQAPASELDCLVVNDKLQVAFRTVEANSCDPIEFAANFPVRQTFASAAATKMHPRSLHLDYRDNAWQGEFRI